MGAMGIKVQGRDGHENGLPEVEEHPQVGGHQKAVGEVMVIFLGFAHARFPVVEDAQEEHPLRHAYQIACIAHIFGRGNRIDVVAPVEHQVEKAQEVHGEGQAAAANPGIFVNALHEVEGRAVDQLVPGAHQRAVHFPLDRCIRHKVFAEIGEEPEIVLGEGEQEKHNPRHPHPYIHGPAL